MTQNNMSVALVGRANVGKSTLFNRLSVQKRRSSSARSIVSERPGATRDMIKANITWDELQFTLYDGAGWMDRPQGALQAAIAEHVKRSIENINLILFLYDARQGVLPEDLALAEFFRKQNKPLLLLANKCEGIIAESQLGEAYTLGLGEPIGVSALHGGGGLQDLYDALSQHITKAKNNDEASPQETIRMTILGRPNVGKSSLVNRLLGEHKALTADMAGVTRDAVEYNFTHAKQEFSLFDTAGMRKKSQIREKLEKMSVESALHSLQYSDVAVLVISAEEPMQKQDFTLANLIENEGRAIVIAINKWDIVKDKKKLLNHIKYQVEKSFAQVKDVRIIPISAITGYNKKALMQAVTAAYKNWNRRVSTGILNRWLSDCVFENPPPVVKGRRLKIKYITQAKTRPPTFIIFSSQAGELPESYMRYLRNKLRDDFNIKGVPLRLQNSKQTPPR